MLHCLSHDCGECVCVGGGGGGGGGGWKGLVAERRGRVRCSTSMTNEWLGGYGCV